MTADNKTETNRAVEDDDRNMADLIVEADTGARAPHDKFSIHTLFYIPLVWSIFQLWIASPLPYIFRIGLWNDTQTRAIHLGFAVFLAFLSFPAFKSGPKHKIPLTTWAVAAVGAASASYLWWQYAGVSDRTGQPSPMDVAIAGIGLALLLEAARRSLGFPLMAAALFFLSYVFFGSWAGLPDVIQWKGASFQKAMSHMWLTSEGVFGVALGVSSGFVFLFVLFGALLNQAGAGNYFLQLAFAGLGHLRGGPAKAAVIASAATGLVSGSSIANVVTTGTFTIPLMKKVGFSPVKAGAIEVSSSINGVLTPPVMGAVAFLMAEYVGVSYVTVVKTAIIPAAISYIALVYIVHLEALKLGMTGTSRMHPVKFYLGAIFIIAMSTVVAGGSLYVAGLAIDGLEAIAGSASTVIVLAVLLVAYIAAVRFAATVDDLEPNVESLENLPPAREIFKTGIHYLLPLFILMYLLIIERKSPGLSAFWTTMVMLLILLTQKPLKAFFRNQDGALMSLKEGVVDIADGLVAGARNMVGLAAAMGVAGLIVGSVTLTGVGQVMAEFVELLSGGNVMLMLLFVALISIILGMGLPTTANYIVVSSLMAGVVVELGAQSGLIVPLIAVHMFVFYYGIMSDTTPPVGLAFFAASAISGADPMRTGVQAFFYSSRTALLPFLFVFNTDLLLIDVGPIQAVFVFIMASVAMLIFAAGTMGYFVTRSRVWESVVLVCVALALFRPGFFLDQFAPEFEPRPASEIYTLVEESGDNTNLRVRMVGETLEGDAVDAKYLLPLGAADQDGLTRLSRSAGIELREEDGAFYVDNLTFGGNAEQLGIDFDWEIAEIEVKADRPRKEIFYIPALLIAALIAFLQRRRKDPDEMEVMS